MTAEIDITMPTTLRPSLLRGTLRSFGAKIFTDRSRYRLIINVDPVGERCSPMDVVEVAKSEFPDVHYNIAESPSFPRAFLWCWRQARTEFVFHMNEDWGLNRPVDIDRMIAILRENPGLASLRLSKFPLIPASRPVVFCCRYTPRGEFLVAERRDNQFGTNPVLLRGEFVRQSVARMSDALNPEKQFRPGNEPLFSEVVMKWDYGIYGKPGDRALIADTGRGWMSEHGFLKNGDGKEFVSWSRKTTPDRECTATGIS